MNSAFYQELINPSKFNLYAGITLVALIVCCLLVLGVALLRKSKQGKTFQADNEEGGKGKGF